MRIFTAFFRVFLLSLLVVSCRQEPEITRDANTNLLDSLDIKIANKKKYEIRKATLIQHYKDSLKLASSDEERYSQNYRIIEAYLGYQCDSAFHYADKNFALAQKDHNDFWYYQNRIQYSILLCSTGLFVEAKSILDSLDRTKIPKGLQAYYDSGYEGLYSALMDYNGDDKRFSDTYRDYLLEYYKAGYEGRQKSDPFSYLYLYNINILQGNYQEAKTDIGQFAKMPITKSTRLYAIANYCTANVYGKLNETAEQEKYLAMAAIADIESSTKENRAQQELALLLYKKGDVKRAFRYIHSALDDANFYNARSRNIQISKVQPIIEEAYVRKINKQNQQLQWSVAAISLMFLLICCAAFFIYKQLQTIVKSRNELSTANKSLQILNHRLDEASKIKEEYIAFFINQCSNYIEKFDGYKKLISRRIVNGRYDKLLEMVNKKNSEMDLNELYENFDTAFLRIYPAFVDEVNSLLRPEERYHLKSKTLNTELRIYALIRLGIKDTSQISEFLRYSLRTIYNYKSKVKAKSIIQNDDFEDRIMKIGDVSAL